MKILYISFGLLDGKAEYFEQQAATEGIRQFAEKLLQHTLENRKTRRCHFKDAGSGTAAGILSFSKEVLKGSQADAEKIKELKRSFAGTLAKAEEAANKKIESMRGEVKKGSLVLAVVWDEAQGLCTVLAKVDHSKWVNGEDLTIKIGFPFDDKDIWKTALVRLAGEKELALGDVSVYMDRPAAYWTDGFLGVVKERTDGDNTEIACRRIGKAISNTLPGIRALELWNTFLQKMKTTSEMNYPEFVDGLVGSEPADPDMKKLRDELLLLPEKFGFDTQFTVVDKALPKSQMQQVLPVNAHMDLILKQGEYDPAQLIMTEADGNGDRWLKIRCTEEKTYRRFKRDE